MPLSKVCEMAVVVFVLFPVNCLRENPIIVGTLIGNISRKTEDCIDIETELSCHLQRGSLQIRSQVQWQGSVEKLALLLLMLALFYLRYTF